MSKNLDMFSLYFVHFFEFIQRRRKIFSIDIFSFSTSKKAKIRLKRATKFDLFKQSMKLQYLYAKDGLKNFDRQGRWSRY